MLPDVRNVLWIGGILAAFAAGWITQGWRKDIAITSMQLQWQQEIATANAEARQNLDAANLLGNQLSDSLEKTKRTQDDNKRLLKEKIDARKTTNPAKCHLDTNWVQLYNSAYGTGKGDTSSATSGTNTTAP